MPLCISEAVVVQSPGEVLPFNNGAFVKSQRGKDLLYFEGYKHRICRVETGGRSSWWRCTKKTCRGRVRLTVEGITLVEQHNHSPLTSVDSYSRLRSSLAGFITPEVGDVPHFYQVRAEVDNEVLESPSAILFVLPSVLLVWERILAIYRQHGLNQRKDNGGGSKDESGRGKWGLMAAQAGLVGVVTPPSGPGMATCPICRRDFRGPYHSTLLRRHMRTHTGEKPYGCPHCPYRANISSNLTRHMRSRHPESPSLLRPHSHIHHHHHHHQQQQHDQEPSGLHRELHLSLPEPTGET
ncbi:Zinc finger protein 536 [Portunus trituberculatus]|uniref:Zinc finger protein 536 n=2 Tax=Portunus trituberculatus TaxID=210409 RepID=A0A5B7EI48_PORTR|nr:Zinc finger protein 536 [Portunus trituberculatus]